MDARAKASALTLALAVCGLLLPATVHASGQGDLTVLWVIAVWYAIAALGVLTLIAMIGETFAIFAALAAAPLGLWTVGTVTLMLWHDVGRWRLIAACGWLVCGAFCAVFVWRLRPRYLEYRLHRMRAATRQVTAASRRPATRWFRDRTDPP